MKKRTLLTTRDVAFSAVLVALGIVTNSFALDTGTHSVTFTYTVCFIAGHFFGPLVGALVGGIGDIVGCFVKGYSPNPLILVGSVLVGLLPGLIQLLSRRAKVKKDLYPPLWTVVSFVVTYVVVTVFWNTFALWFSYARASKTYWVYMLARLPLQTIVWAINLGLSLVLYPVLSRVLRVSPTSVIQKIKERKDEDVPPAPRPRRTVKQVLCQDYLNPFLAATIVTGVILVAVLIGVLYCRV
ncbi:MAG: folate family ECF transporter S component [Clostridia bacterium]|nr:folate family ECF transporter S component [Clostridia bacterium]